MPSFPTQSSRRGGARPHRGSGPLCWAHAGFAAHGGRGPWSRPPERPPAPPLASVLRPQGGCCTSGRGVCVPGGKESGVWASWLSGRAGCGVRGGGGYYLSLELNLCFHLSQNVPLWFQDRLGSTGLRVPPAPASLRLPEDAFSSRPGSWALPPAPPPTPIPAPQGLPHSPSPASPPSDGRSEALNGPWGCPPVLAPARPGWPSPRTCSVPRAACSVALRCRLHVGRLQLRAGQLTPCDSVGTGAGGREGGAAVCLVRDCSGETPDSATVPRSKANGSCGCPTLPGVTSSAFWLGTLGPGTH